MRLGACMKNDKGDLLLYTTQSCISMCEEHCIERWGVDMYQKLLDLGGKIVQIEVKEIT